jgi:hypothetical protein
MSTSTRIAWQLRQVERFGAMALDAASTSGAGVLKAWQAAQWIVRSLIAPNWIVLSVWHPDCAHVSSTAANWWSDVAWHSTHCSPSSSGSSDSKCTRCPAELAIGNHFSGSPRI